MVLVVVLLAWRYALLLGACDDRERMSTPRPSAVELTVVHVDPVFVVLHKPAGMPTQPGAGHLDDTLLNAAMNRWRRQLEALGARRDYGLVHRLDLTTSGCVVLALTAEAYDSLRGQFASGRVGKEYLAIVRGRLPAKEGTIELPLNEVRRGRLKVSVSGRAGEAACTHYSTVARAGEFALLRVRIETGRLHQIRAHLSLAGAPIVGDPVYRALLEPNTSAPVNEVTALPLHAWRLAFDHPVSGQRIEAVAPPGRSFVDQMQELFPGTGIPNVERGS